MTFDRKELFKLNKRFSKYIALLLAILLFIPFNLLPSRADSSYNITVNYNDNGQTAPQTVVASAVGDIPIPEREGYVFNGWYIANDDGTPSETPSPIAFTEDISISAAWRIVIHSGNVISNELMTVEKRADFYADTKTGVLELGAYLKGKVESVPTDVVMVIDHSGSMWTSADPTSPVPFAELQTTEETGQHPGYYVGFTQDNGVNKAFLLRYYNGEWQRGKYFGSSSTVDLTKYSVNTTCGTNRQWTTLVDSSNYIYFKSITGTLYDALYSFMHEMKFAQNCRVAMVTFSGTHTTSTQYNGSGIFIDGTLYADGTAPKLSNYADAFENPASLEGNAILQANIDAINTDFGYTPTAMGLMFARRLFIQASSSNTNKVVVVFTDGMPSPGYIWGRAPERGYSSTVTYNGETKTCTNYIDQAACLRAEGATIYAVGPKSGGQSDTVLENIASGGQFFTAGGDEINQVFKDIAADIVSVSQALNSSTVLQDDLTNQIELSDDVVIENGVIEGIELYTMDCVDISGDTYTFGNKQPLNDATIAVNGKSIQISNFDYSANAVYETGGKVYGKKIVVQIPVKITENVVPGVEIETNAGTSGIYIKGADDELQAVEQFPVPSIELPPTSPYAYVDGVLGSDDNNGLTPSTAFKTFKRAYELLGAGGTIYVVNSVKIDQNIELGDTYYRDNSTNIQLKEGSEVKILRYSQPFRNQDNDDSNDMLGFNIPSNTNTMLIVGKGSKLTMDGIEVSGHGYDENSHDELQFNAPGMTTGATAIQVSGALELKGCYFSEHLSTASSGGAVTGMSNSELTIKDSVFNDCSASNGGSIYNMGKLDVETSEIFYNYGVNGGGLYNSGTAAIKDSHFEFCDAANTGGAIFNNGTLTMDGTTLLDSRAVSGGGIWNNGTLTLNDCEIRFNQAGDNGGGIANSGTLNLNDGWIEDNDALVGSGIYHEKGVLTGGNITVSLSDDVYLQSGQSITFQETQETPIAINFVVQNPSEHGVIATYPITGDAGEKAYKFLTSTEHELPMYAVNVAAGNYLAIKFATGAEETRSEEYYWGEPFELEEGRSIDSERKFVSWRAYVDRENPEYLPGNSLFYLVRNEDLEATLTHRQRVIYQLKNGLTFADGTIQNVMEFENGVLVAGEYKSHCGETSGWFWDKHSGDEFPYELLDTFEQDLIIFGPFLS